MELTNKQEQGLRLALEKYYNGDKYVVIGGYAGTGKSTLVRFIIDALELDEEDVAYVAYTGKAAEVLRKKGNTNAMTLHKLLYQSIPKPTGGFIHKPKTELEYDVVVVDEVSMLPRSMMDLLFRHNVFCILLGDNLQLPQIDKNESHDLLKHCDIFLDEVMRQAQESEIIRLTMDIRAGRPIDYTKGKEIIVMPKSELTTSHLTWADQIICAKNDTRVALNNQMRQIYGFKGGIPQHGEKLICLRNYWDDIDDDGESSLVNGMTGIVEHPLTTYRLVPRRFKVSNPRMDLVIADFITDDGKRFNAVDMDRKLLETGTYSLDWKDSYILGKAINQIGDIRPREFTYGYAITCWKAQGSEFNKVLAFEENFPFDKEEHKRYLYTACTRASEKLVLVR